VHRSHSGSVARYTIINASNDVEFFTVLEGTTMGVEVVSVSPEKRHALAWAAHRTSDLSGPTAAVAPTATRCSGYAGGEVMKWDEVTVPTIFPGRRRDHYERVVMNAGTTWDYFGTSIPAPEATSNDFREPAPRRVHRPDGNRLGDRTAGWCAEGGCGVHL
jgi:hypothetical protein